MTAPRQARKTTTKPTSVSEWKKKNDNAPIQLPSGCYMKLKAIGLHTILATGIMPNSLMGFAQTAIGKGQTGPQDVSTEDLIDLVQDQKKVQDIIQFFDKLICLVALEPAVHPAPAAGVERDDDLLYTDEVDETDKMFIFQVVTGGTANLEEFRSETGAAMAAIRGREDVELPS